MKKRTSNILIWSSLAYLSLHAFFKLYASLSDWQHWLVAVSVVLIAIGILGRK